MLSKISNCQGLPVRAEEYAHRLVVDDEIDQGRYWLKEKGEFWSFTKRAHYQVPSRSSIKDLYNIDADIRLGELRLAGQAFSES